MSTQVCWKWVPDFFNYHCDVKIPSNELTLGIGVPCCSAQRTCARSEMSMTGRPRRQHRHLWFVIGYIRSADVFEVSLYTEWSKKWEPVSFLPITLPNLKRFAEFFHCLKEKEIYNNNCMHSATPIYVAALPCEVTKTFKYAASLKNKNKMHWFCVCWMQFI